MATAVEGAPRTAAAATTDRRFAVDLWATSINDVEIGIMKQTQHRAKSTQFTKDMDVIGQIREDGRRTGVVAYREGLWKEKSGVEKRLVLKLFSETMSWRATMDMMIGRSLQLTHGADGMTVLAFMINAARNDHAIQLERSAYKLAFFPERFSFAIHGEAGPRFYKLRQNLFSFGADYDLYDQSDRKIGVIDGKLASVGGYWKVRCEAAHATTSLDMTLQLFCAMLRFNKDARRHVDALAAEMRAGRIRGALEANERDLYLNPRRAR